ncbi:uncharacterized protein BDR25DRAFT_368574 [Lindgomyces ingoldianus]|uniref:Uncharacterized protein n=1 Tax=Lindgomyces ingoldianus TaxID=673940 RepID=A0ACB6QVI7_9PLEO|nr:uncharacterized protein BDR25DRAFT_368574 [Lindgomyces ingoldianus]KAF2470895.1 hypothetical protein BDR25DRAFT_368574 [Lindgomyces ingoldianus]
MLLSSGFFNHIVYTDEAHVDLTSQAQGRITREQGTRDLLENIKERSPLKVSRGKFTERGLQSHASLGVDCHSNNAGSVVSEARLGLQNARCNFNQYYHDQGKTPSRLPDSLSVEAAFNLATIKGAEAARLETEVGKIAVGMRADLVVWDALSPAMVAAAQHDPVAAVILHSSPADIELVLVDGVVRKQDGKLLRVSVDEFAIQPVGKEKLEWREIAKEIVKSREKIQKNMDEIDFVQGKQGLMKLFGVDGAKFVDLD